MMSGEKWLDDLNSCSQADSIMRIPTRILAAALLLSASVAPLTGWAAPERNSNGEFRGRVAATSVADLGLAKGFRFEGAGVVHSHTFTFPGLWDTAVESARFRMVYRASPLLNELANLRVEVDGIPVYTKALAHDVELHEATVPVTPGQVRDGYVQVSVKTALPASDNRCLDERMAASYFHILPESGLEIQYSRPPDSLRDAWRLLPKTVTISLPQGVLTERSFTAAWALADLLYQDGRRVRFARLPELGDIVLGSRDAIAAALAATYGPEVVDPQRRAREALATESNNLFFVADGQTEFLAVTEPFDAQSLYLLASKWRTLAAGNGYGSHKLPFPASNAVLAPLPDRDRLYRLPLSSLGLDTGPRFIETRTVWEAVVEPRNLPPRMRPKYASLKVLVPVRTAERGYELYVYLNDVLLRAERLKATGQMQEVTVSLPEKYQQQIDVLKFVAQYDGPEGDCLANRDVFPIQIAPDSALVIESDDTLPEEFRQLPRHLSGGFDVFLHRDFLDAGAEGALNLVARLSADFPLTVDYGRVRFLDGQTPLQPDAPFVAVGPLNLQASRMPVSFDRGSVEVIDARGNKLLDVNALPGLTVAQLVGQGETAQGLWVRTAAERGFPELGGLHLRQDDVAFADHTGIVLTLNSDTPSLARVHYPEIKTWFVILEAYRFWFLALAWLALTLLFVYLYRKTRRHDAPSDTAGGSPANTDDAVRAGMPEEGRRR